MWLAKFTLWMMKRIYFPDLQGVLICVGVDKAKGIVKFRTFPDEVAAATYFAEREQLTQ